jgi:bromodomain and WD repeat domain-containing protein 1/3
LNTSSTSALNNSSTTYKKIKNKKSKSKNQKPIGNLTECPTEYRPPEWLTSTKPRKSPYVPQVGDEVVYFRQGHELYVNSVRNSGTYELDMASLPWNQENIKDLIGVQEFCSVVGMKYEIRPPRLVCLKLAIINPITGEITGTKFSIKYHDMEHVVDFVILKQFYDSALEKNWRRKDHFKCIIEDQWYTGLIEAKEPFQEEYPESLFQCLKVVWDEEGQTEMLSPWDLEPLSGINARKSKPASSAQVPHNGDPVTSEELKSLLYTPKRGEWPEEGREAECARILVGLEKIMELSLAEHFNYPVDLDAYPSYAILIPYPIDLNTIKERLENNYYRRLNSILYDIRLIEKNASKFNEKKSEIVNKANLLTSILTEFVSDSLCTNPIPIYKRLSKDRNNLTIIENEENEEDEDIENNHDTNNVNNQGQRVTRRRVESGNLNQSNPTTSSSTKHRSFNLRKRESNLDDTKLYLDISFSKTTPSLWWRNACKKLINDIIKHRDSEPFRNPVDLEEYPDYTSVVAQPMDFSTIRHNLTYNFYEDLSDFDKACKLIFKNSRSYNTNKRSAVIILFKLSDSSLFADILT